MLVGIALIAAPKFSHADAWVVGEAPAALPISSVQHSVFRPGVMPALGAYIDNGWLALGLRVRAGILRDGPAPNSNLADPATGGLVTGTVALRIHRGGMWVELAGGGGLTGSNPVPTVEAGVGWDFTVGDLAIGPGVRYVDVIARDPMATLGSASLVLVGMDVQWTGRRTPPPRAPRIVAAVAPAAPPPPPPAIETIADGDRVVDRDASCAERLDGCPISPHLTIANDRIVLDERVLFDTDQARVRSSGRALIAEVAAAWRAHPEWRRITIEGHCDVRGDDAYNQALSERRAERARAVLLRSGFAPESVDAVGYGRARPRDPGTSREALQRNRRVEFVIDREVAP